MNLPNAITAARIAAAPLIAWLPFSSSPWPRLLAFVLFVVAAVTDYIDGRLARERNMVTDLGRLLDPLADKLLLLATFIPMFILMAPAGDPAAELLGVQDVQQFEFATPVGEVGLPWWVVAVILGREIFMTVFRQAAAKKGVVIAAIGPAKWKTGFQSTWVGAAYFWFFAVTIAAVEGWVHDAWHAASMFIGLVGVVTMAAAFVMTLYSLWVYLARYGRVFRSA